MAEFIGIDGNWQRDALEGLAWGGFFIFLNLFTGIAIGLPDFPQQAAGKYGIVSVIAPVFEEIGFRGILLFLMLPLGLIPAYIINMIVFSIFHFAAYGASLSAMSGSFIGTALFSAFAVFVTLKNRNVITAIVAHAVFNTFLLSRYFVLVPVS